MSTTVALMRDRSRPLRQTGRHSGGRNFGGVRTQAGSELSRQVSVDLKPDADLSKSRGCPGHWSSSLPFSSANKGSPWRAATQARQPHGRPPTLTRQRNSIAEPPWGSQRQRRPPSQKHVLYRRAACYVDRIFRQLLRACRERPRSRCPSVTVT